ncbi:ORF-119 [Teiidae poxvirus 1]|nr:ORF-119 [Teiidae poxvirus 1]
MSKLSDLKKLRELVELKKNIHILGKYKTNRYNELLEWANNTYWTVGSSSIEREYVSIDGYYRKNKNSLYLLQGRYYFLHRYFGIRYVYLHDTMYEKNTGYETSINTELQSKIKLLLKKYSQIKFIVFVEYKNVFIVEDIVFKNNNNKLIKIFGFAQSIGLTISGHLSLQIDNRVLLTKEYYELITTNINRVKGFYTNGLICVREDSVVRETFPIRPREFCCVQSLKLESIKENLWIPYAITFNNEKLRFTGVESLIDARVFIGSFVSVIKFRNTLLLPENVASGSKSPKIEYTRKLLEYFDNQFFISGNYMAKTRTTEVDQIDCELLPYKTTNELEMKLQDDYFVSQLKSKSLFDLTCEYFLHDREKVIKLINEMEFKLDRDNKIVSYELLTRKVLQGDKGVEDIYLNFHKFVITFNSLTAAKSMVI